MEFYQVCKCSSGGRIQDPLLCAPCPPPMMTYDEFLAHVFSQNLSQVEVCKITRRCGYDDIDVDKNYSLKTSTATLSTSVSDYSAVSRISDSDVGTTGQSVSFLSSTSHTPSFGSCPHTSSIICGPMCLGIIVSVLCAIIIFLMIIVVVLVKRKRIIHPYQHRDSEESSNLENCNESNSSNAAKVSSSPEENSKQKKQNITVETNHSGHSVKQMEE
ncbi:uncharacterized protein LOC123545281 [Mercenaria mercenaria]|uniref:uncharacterized protein LOC123545281 n=1 Tax=Mercenaria mercenaria TaxID=6596 RepID=UPI001E1D5F36|nr:uncharacterized protein LOC123545281 [Mercenaria mercenaria]